eukprot:m.6149 g.6149  ORF g.6149 m.6149 type:complete len:324 (-) comp4657_c0_seq2:134-1105(-)
MSQANRFATETQLSLQRATETHSTLPTPRAIPGYNGHVQGLRDYDPGRRFASATAKLSVHAKTDQKKPAPTRFLNFGPKPRQTRSLSANPDSRQTHNNNNNHNNNTTTANYNRRTLPVHTLSVTPFTDMSSDAAHSLILQQREESRDVLYRDHMVPGYTGHVPHLRERLATPFGSATAEAIASYDKTRLRGKERQRMCRSSPALRPVVADRRDTTSAEELAFDASKNNTKYVAPFTDRSAYSRKAGLMPGTTIYVPFREHTSLGRTYQTAARESVKLLRASQSNSNQITTDKTLNDLARSLKPKTGTNKPLYTRGSKREWILP